MVLQTVRAATRHAGGITAAVEAGAVPATVAALVNGELSTMATISWKSIAVLLLLGGTVTAGVVSLALRGSDAGAGEPAMHVAASEPATAAAELASQAKADSKSLLTNGGVEEGAGDSPKAWTAGATIPGVEYVWSRDGAHGQGQPLPEEDSPTLLPDRPVVSEGGSSRRQSSPEGLGLGQG